jgi:serine/threonine protein kinase
MTEGVQIGISIIKTLGVGHQATIILCDQNGSLFVIKDCKLPRYKHNETSILTRFRGSPHTVQLVDIELPSQYSIRGVPLRFYENGDLFNVLCSLHEQNKVTESLAKSIFKQVLLAISELHSNLVAHRDLKPENFFVDEKFNIVLGDFGLSCAHCETKWDNAVVDEVCGTQAYMAPEIVNCSTTGTSYNSYQADMWSAGCLLFMIVTGNMPFGENGACPKDWYYVQVKNAKWESFWDQHQSACPLQIPLAVKAIVESLLNVNPSQRPAAHELLENIWFKDETVCSDSSYIETMKDCLDRL